jgi:hypothetical protein
MLQERELKSCVILQHSVRVSIKFIFQHTLQYFVNLSALPPEKEPSKDWTGD